MAEGVSVVGRRIMLIDFDESYLRVLEGMLLKCDCRVTTSRKVWQAFSRLREKSGDYDLILSSVNMPDIEDFKLVYIIRFKLQIPVILMSYDEEPNFILNGMIARGSCGYLKKPIHIDTLRNLWQCDYLQSWQFKRRAIQLQSRVCRSKCFGPDAKTSDAVDEGKLEPEILVECTKGSDNSVAWTREVQLIFEEAVSEIGIDKANAENILLAMNVEGLTIRQVRMQWRWYLKQVKRTIAREDPPEVVSDGSDVNYRKRHGPESSEGEPLQQDDLITRHGRQASAGELLQRENIFTNFRGKKKYLFWTPELHQQFETAVKELGGFERATPKKIFDKMKVEGVEYAHVANHWGAYRRKRATKVGSKESPQEECKVLTPDTVNC